MDWDAWHKHYDELPGLQARLIIVRAQIAAALDECPPGPIRVVSLCAGDGRDLLGALENHPRRADVAAVLLDSHAESIARGQAAALAAGLESQLRFTVADAALAKNYADAVPADVVLLSGFLGHLRHENIPSLIRHLPMFCRPGASVIWNRHLVMHKGREQVPLIRERLQQNGFAELDFSTTGPDGFAAGRARFTGETLPLDESLLLFEFIGLDRLLGVALPSPSENFSAGETDSQLAAELEVLAENSIPARFAEMAAQHPARTALGGGAWSPTYAELHRVTNRFARTLLADGAATGTRVALLLRQDAPLIAAALAVLKAGRVVVVLNPTEPVERLRQIVADAEPVALLTDTANAELAATIAASLLPVTNFDPATIAGVDAALEIKIAPGDLTWLVYTSGSTGRPRGVMQTHRNILHNVLRLSRGLEARAEDRLALLASPSGGQGLATLWCALLNGAALHPFPTAERGVTGLKDWLAENKISIYVSSVSVFRRFVQHLAEGEVLPGVRLVRFGSESANTGDFAAWKKHFAAGSVLLNSYSSSETANVTQHRLTHGDTFGGGRLPVGWAAAGMEIFLRDENGRDVAPGETGEIIVRSRHLSPGYWRDETLTAEKFRAVAGENNLREFRTGDFGRRTVTGALVFMDRRDDRIKIQGYRVELSEIETALAALPEVAAAVVVARATESGDQKIAAYVVLRERGRTDAESLRRRLQAVLPGHMVPANFIFLDEFPLTPHGKIDRQALPAPPAPGAPSVRSAHYQKPRDMAERSLVRIWKSVLGIQQIGRSDDFFTLGGTSLQGVETMLAVEELFNVALPPSTLVEYNTIEKLAALLSDRAFIASPSPLVALRPDAGGAAPLFLIHSGQGDVVTYGLLTRRLPGRAIYGLQAVGVQGEAWPLMSISKMAECYLPELLAKNPDGPFLIAGTCMGGMVAFELAQRLVAQGRTVALLGLIDTATAPYGGQRPIWHEALLDPVRDALRILRWGVLAGWRRTVPVALLPGYRGFVAAMTGWANRRYRPQFFPGTVTLFLTTDEKYQQGDRRELISKFAQATRRLVLPGKRSALFLRPMVDELAAHLQACLNEADKKFPPKK